MGPLQLTGETHAYTDLVFGLFRPPGYRFSPRVADLDNLRYWRLDGDADHRPLDGPARNRVKADLIVGNLAAMCGTYGGVA